MYDLNNPDKQGHFQGGFIWEMKTCVTQKTLSIWFLDFPVQIFSEIFLITYLIKAHCLVIAVWETNLLAYEKGPCTERAFFSFS